MKRETVKTLVLSFLIIVSLFFTWSIWTFQPTYDPLESMTYLETLKLSDDKREFSEVVKPQQVFYHENKTTHYGADKQLDKIWRAMADWKLEEANDLSSRYSEAEFLQFIHGLDGRKKLELVFSQTIPSKTFQSILDWETKEAVNKAFDRIIIPFDGVKTPTVYFVSTQGKLVYEVKMKHDVVTQLQGQYFSNAEEEGYPRYFANSFNKDAVLMLPEKKRVFNRFSYTFSNIDDEDFKQALYNNPSYVSRGYNKSDSVYTDGSRRMVIEKDSGFSQITYTAGGKKDKTIEPALSKVMEQSLDYLNSHGGWTDDYVFFGHSPDLEITLRMLINNLPVFPSKETPSIRTDIFQEWGSTEIIRYERPGYRTKRHSSQEPILLPDGKEILAMLTESKGEMNINNVVRVFPAYELQSSEDLNVIVNPVWYAETKSGNYRVIEDPKTLGGGRQDGLE
ncbi:YycH family regulatory protein [Bacillus sp. SJS]|uniref:YycH family regulatory protein n=1 Tax=Bacillus sp. SJS TaxID=1423321 RepID=UPI0004DD471C|nr:two-component system activity regulator YycH [Bacillus sp. SJS]KZZ85303.1 hypothetical protein AS29_005875 [Bacillus sp. SJS]